MKVGLWRPCLHAVPPARPMGDSTTSAVSRHEVTQDMGTLHQFGAPVNAQATNGKLL